MPVESDKVASSRRYLLGMLTPDDTARLEEEFFSNDDTFEEIEMAEDELVDAYVRDALPRVERHQFEQKLLPNPRIVERIEFAKVLKKAARVGPRHPKITPEPYSWWRSLLAYLSAPRTLGFATAGVILFVAGGLLFSDWLRLRQETRRLASERTQLQRQNEDLAARIDAGNRKLSEEKTTNEALNAKLQETLENQEQSSPLALMSPLFLFPGASRGTSGSDDLTIPSKPAVVRLRLALESDDYPRYNAEVRRGVDGPIILRKNNLTPATTRSNKVIDLRFSSVLLTPHDYTVNLNGVKPPTPPEFVAVYSFRAVAK